MRAFWILVGLATLLPACGDEELTGKWRGELTVTPEGEVFLTIEQDYENIFGSARYSDLEQGEVQTTVQGKVKDNDIELELLGLDSPTFYEANRQGDDMMTGTWSRRGTSEKLTLKRL